jgi:hypothetical protein
MTSPSRIRVLSGFTLAAALASAVLSGVLSCRPLGAAQEPGKDKEDEARREQQLNNMKRSAAQYAVATDEDRKLPFRFHQNAALRFSNPAVGTRDGALYVWSDHGRPQAVLKLYTYNNETFAHEWQSLSERTLIVQRQGKTVWNPTESGVTFRELADAAKPAELAEARLRQMKSLARKFSSTYTHLRKGSNWPSRK